MTQQEPEVTKDPITDAEKDLASAGKIKAGATPAESAQTPANGVETDAVVIPTPEEAQHRAELTTPVDTTVDGDEQTPTAVNGDTTTSGGQEPAAGNGATADVDENPATTLSAASASDASESAATDPLTAKDSDDQANSDTPAAEPDELTVEASVPKNEPVQPEMKAEKEPQPVFKTQETLQPEAKEDEKSQSEERSEESSQPDKTGEPQPTREAEEELQSSAKAENSPQPVLVREAEPEAHQKLCDEPKAEEVEEFDQAKSEQEHREQPQQQADNMCAEAQPVIDTDASTYATAAGSRAPSEAASSVEAEAAPPPGTVQALSRRLSNNSMGSLSTAVTPIRTVQADKPLGPPSTRTTKSPVASPVSQHDTTNTINVSQLLKSGAFKLQPLKDFVKYEELQRLRVEDGIDATRKEDYLNDDEFKHLFGVDREAFKKQPAWRQAQAKKKANLY